TRPTQVLLQLVQQGRRLARFAWASMAAGLLLLVLGVLLERDRQRGLLLASYDLVGAGLFVALLLPLGRAALGLLAGGPLERAAAAGFYDAFAGGLRAWALGLVGIGLVFGAAAHSLLEDVGVVEVLRRLGHLLDHPPGGVPGRLVRALGLLCFGTLAVARPQTALDALMLLGGAGIAFLGLLELFRLVQSGFLHGRAPLAEPVAGPAASGDSRAGLRRVVLVLAVAGVLAAAVAWMAWPEAAPPPVAGAADTCNGDAALCDRRVDQVVFPGAHNAMSSADVDRWMFPQQERGVASMLADGVRALLVDVHYGRPVLGSETVKTDLGAEQGSRAKMEEAVGAEGLAAAMRIRDRLTGREEGAQGLYLCHGFCELGALPLVPWLSTLRDFLAANPGDVLVLVIEDYIAPGELAAAFKESGLDTLVFRGPAAPPWPTLRELADSRQRVLVFTETGTPGVPWIQPAFEAIQETPYRFRKPADFSCAAHRGGTAGSLFQINHWIDTTPDPKPSNAAIVNAYDFLLARARQCEAERKKLPNVVAVDFYRTGALLRVVRTLNGLDREGEARP
ncbi:MAG TPA: hypothetical protein VI589_03065, partial [Vicinamibacteria bacterium]